MSKMYSYESPSLEYLEMVEMYKTMHSEGASSSGKQAEQTFTGGMLLEHVLPIRDIIRKTGARDLLDYGAGKASLYSARNITLDNGKQVSSIQDYWGVDGITFYDPGYEPYSARPTRCHDGVISIDVVEHITEPDVVWVIDEMFAMANRFVYANIACFPAVKNLPNGQNAHCTVKSPDWWAGLIHSAAMRHLDISYRFVMTTKTGPRQKMGFGRNRKTEQHIYERLVHG